ncbi:MAG: nuclear transport factor 2 family protein [Rhizobacter sp.]|nr:nuclear transport factor 2 family protein [Ferruginibacter sp.]
MKARETIVENYIAGYNEMNVQKMVKDLDVSVIFKNVSNERVDLELHGLENFRQQAERALVLFAERKQTINAVRHQNGAVELDIDYYARIARPLQSSAKGPELHFTGTAVFTFNKDNKITSITDTR